MIPSKNDPNQMSFLEHLGELRKRILHSLLGILVVFIGCYYKSDVIFYYTMKPLKEVMPDNFGLIGTGLAEAFTARILMSAVAALFISSPFWFYQIWKFISPGMYQKEKMMALPFVLFATVSFIGGVVFGYYMVFPPAFSFFLDEYKAAGLDAQIRISQYLSFISRLLIAFGVCFELPIISFFLGRIGILTWQFMYRTFKYAVVVIFIVAAVLTPGPDVASQMMLAAPLLILYSFSILIVAITGKKKKSGDVVDKPASKE